MADHTTTSPVKLPRELLGVSATALENYVRSRLLQFIRRFHVSLSQLLPGVATPAVLDRAAADTLRALPLPDYGEVPLERRQLQLVFRHDCQALGCLEPQCPLCQHTSKRRCTVNFCKKYLVNDRMLARCGAQIRVEVIDRATGRLCDSDLSDVFLEVFVLNGASYDQHFLDATRPSTLARADSSNPDSIEALNNDLDECALLTNKRNKPLLVSLTGAKSNNDDGKLVIQAVRGRVVLPDLTVTDSSEALLSGRKPPFRLVVRAKRRGGQQLSLRPAVSEAFVVTTRRVKTSNKAEIPTMDESVATLLHMGKETCRKLADLSTAADQADLELDLEEELTCIEKVGQFKTLALRAETDSSLRQTLQTLLKLPKDKWDECVEHAKRAVFPDDRPRAWYSDRTQMVGLLFSATLGVVDLKRPQGLLQRVLLVDPAAGVTQLQLAEQQQQTPVQRDAVRQLLPQAEECWWSPGHPGWTLFDPQELNTVEPAGPAAAAAAAGGTPPPQLQQGYVGAQQTVPAVAAAAASVMPQQASFSFSAGHPQQQQQQQHQQQAVAAGQLPPPGSPLQETYSNSSSFPQAHWMQHSPAAQHANIQAAAQQQQQQQQHQRPPSPALFQQAAAAATATPQRQPSPAFVTATPKTAAPPPFAALGSPFGALAAEPIAPPADSPQRTERASPAATPPPFAAAAGAGATAMTTAAAAAAAARGLDTSGSSGLDSSLQPPSRRSSGGLLGSWLPPLSGRKRSFALASSSTPGGGGGADAAAADGGTTTAAAGRTASQQAAATQLSADVEKLLSAAGFNPSSSLLNPPAAAAAGGDAGGGGPALREAPSLTAFPSMGLFLDTVSPAAAAGGGTGASLLQRPSTAVAAPPSRAASAGLSRLLSLDLASLLRGTSLLPPVSAGGLPSAAAAAAAFEAAGNYSPLPQQQQQAQQAVGGAGVDGSSGGVAGISVGAVQLDDEGLPTPHAAAAAEGLMALSSDLGAGGGGGSGGGVGRTG